MTGITYRHHAVKRIKYLNSLPKAPEIFYNIKPFNHDESLSKTILLYSYGIVQHARMTCKFYSFLIAKGHMRLNIFSFCHYTCK